MRKRIATSAIILSPLWASAATTILVPAYFDPSASSDWNTLNNSVSSAVPITAIMNPNSGPVANVDPNYTAAISTFQAAGGKVVAYVHTTNGNRNISTVEAEINTYKSQYPNLNGIFVDEMDNTTGKLSYYRNLYNFIKSANASWQVIGNPGTDTLQSYLSPAPAADELITFENATGYDTYSAPAWQYNFSATSFGNIAYNVPDVATMQTNLSRAAANNAGNVYFTDLTGANPYLALPSYWSAEVTAVRLMNLRSTYTRNGAGDFNSAGNWSSIVPNAVDAEADFLSAISANHTVYSDSPITLGKIVLNNSFTYVIAGAGSLTMQSSTGSASISAMAGTQKISLPVVITSDASLNADAGATLVLSGPITVNAGKSLSETGSGVVKILGSLTVQPGGAVNFVAGSSISSLTLMNASTASISGVASGSALEVNQLSIAFDARLDLKNQDLLLHSGDLVAANALLRSGLMSGNGIVSSSAVGAVNGDGQTVFDGKAVSATDVLLHCTVFGDANIDGLVDPSDYSRIDAGYVQKLTGWANGDFNYDGVIDGSDYSLIDNSFNRSSSRLLAVNTSLVSVPEPFFVSLIVVGMMLSRKRRRKLSFHSTGG